MSDKPRYASGYKNEQAKLVRSVCLYAATKLGDIMDELVVIGGLVPSLLIDQENLPEHIDNHVGTMDLDIGMKLALLDEKRYQTLTSRLRNSGFSPDVNEKGNPTHQRWKFDKEETITIDFLIPPSLPGDRGGKLRNIETDFAAVIVPGLHLAFKDRKKIQLSGKTIMGERAKRSVWVCGPGAFVVLKSLAFRLRGENKDAYDLYYLIRNYGEDIKDVVNSLKPLLKYSDAIKAIDILKEDFLEHDGLGPLRVAEFLTNETNDEIQADVVSYIQSLIGFC